MIRLQNCAEALERMRTAKSEYTAATLAYRRTPGEQTALNLTAAYNRYALAANAVAQFGDYEIQAVHGRQLAHEFATKNESINETGAQRLRAWASRLP